MCVNMHVCVCVCVFHSQLPLSPRLPVFTAVTPARDVECGAGEVALALVNVQRRIHALERVHTPVVNAHCEQQESLHVRVCVCVCEM
jgi:hypothetical protein